MSDRVPGAPDPGEIATRVRNFDWASTSLGPMASWPSQLRAAIDIALASQAQIVLFCGPEFLAVYNDAYAPTIGTKHPAALGRPASEHWSELWDDLEPLLRRVADSGETVFARDRAFYIERGAGPETVFFDISYSPVRDDKGEVVAIFCVVNETTDRVGYEAKLNRLASIVSSSQDAILGIDLDLTVTDWNDGAEKLYGFARDEIVGKSVTALIPPDRLDEEARIIEQIKAGGHVEPHETVRMNKDGRPVDVSLSVSPIHDARGRVVGASKIARDISDRKAAEQAQKVLIGELNHRVKNLLATVLAIARQTFRNVEDLDASRSSFEARLLNLAKAHDLLTTSGWEKASLQQVVENALAPFSSSRIDVEGPPLKLQPKAAVAVALILHELATNASKYGALSTPDGRVSVTWTIEDEGEARFRLSWREAGGPPVVAPARKGFGSRLIESMVFQLDGTFELTYEPDGVSCRIDAPLSSDWRDTDLDIVDQK